jgi:hypothetical protein
MPYFLSRFNKRQVYNLITLTESFTWEELPMQHPDTGETTKAGYIQKIPVIGKRVITLLLAFHGIQSAVRMIHSHDMIFTKWYPFDVTVSPAYELANLSQVMLIIRLLPFENHKCIQTDEYSNQMHSNLTWANNYLTQIL